MARAIAVGFPYHLTHRGKRRDPVFFRQADRTEYQRILGERAEREGLDVWASRTGRPLGDEGFVRRLERLLGRSLAPKKPGRPRKNSVERE
ncbi:hypothetical protein KQI84_18135 [bacterium]|nr:hypothetical protein [bacterium]